MDTTPVSLNKSTTLIRRLQIRVCKMAEQVRSFRRSLMTCFSSLELEGVRREATSQSWPLTSSHLLYHVCAPHAMSYTQPIMIQKKKAIGPAGAAGELRWQESASPLNPRHFNLPGSVWCSDHGVQEGPERTAFWEKAPEITTIPLF